MAFVLVSIGIPKLENMRRLHRIRRSDAIASMNEGMLFWGYHSRITTLSLLDFLFKNHSHTTRYD